MSRAQVKEFIVGLGGIEAATDYMLSRGFRENHETNKRIRQTRRQGRVIDDDRDNLDNVLGIVEKPRPGGAARRVDIDQWNAVLALYPLNGRHRDVLAASARHGFGEVAEIAREVGRCERRVRQIQDWLWAWATKNLAPALIAKHMDDPITQEAVVRRPPSRAGRKPKGWVAPGFEIKTAKVIIGFDLFGDPTLPRKPRRIRKAAGVRRVRVRPEIPGQMEFPFDMAA
jgi:hypothetical protein